MAAPLSADRMLAALRAEGLHVIEHPGWRTHNREGHGAWGPVNGVIIHHTGGTPPSDGEIVWAGRSDLPGPCAHGYLAKDGTLTLTGHGRANHAGDGDGNVLQAVIDESYGDRPPAPHQHEGSAGAIDGNAHFYGLECSNPGDGSTWPAVQYDAMVRWAVAICRAHGWTAKSVIGHKEWSDWKPDPRGIDMKDFRRDVAACLALPAGHWNSTQEEEMDPVDVWAYKGKSKLAQDGGGKETEDAYAYLRTTRAAVKTLTAQVGALTATVSKLAQGGGLDATEIKAAAEAGAQAALDRLADALKEG